MKQRFTKRTRLVSALLTLAMVFTFLPFSAFAAGTEVAINATNFPDPAFLSLSSSMIKITMVLSACLKEKVLHGFNVTTKELIRLKELDILANLPSWNAIIIT